MRIPSPSSLLIRYSSLLIALLLTEGLYAQVKWNQAYQTYIDQYKDIAIEEMLKYNIPASITLAQGLLESGAGRSELTRKANNHFGIKCHGWQGRTSYHDDDETQECFRAYDTALESYEDHSKFLTTRRRYESLFSLSRTDYKGWAHGLKKAGYATNPNYATHLINIIETYGLHQYDLATKSSMRHSVRETLKEQSEGIKVLYEVKRCNGLYYVYAKEGDTFQSVGEEMGVKPKKLARYNEREADDRLTKGEIIYLQKKKKKASKVFRGVPHTVRAGDSMYSIAQMYGIRLKYLYKMNNMSPDDTIAVGDELRVY